MRGAESAWIAISRENGGLGNRSELGDVKEGGIAYKRSTSGRFEAMRRSKTSINRVEAELHDKT